MEQTFEYTVTKRQQVNYDNNFSKILNLEKYKNLLKKINLFFKSLNTALLNSYFCNYSFC